MHITKQIDQTFHSGDKITWKLKFNGSDEFYDIKERTFTVGNKDAILTDITDVISGKEHMFKLFNDNPFDDNVILNFLDEKIDKNERKWKYGDRVDINKEIGEDIEYTVTKTGYAHKGSFKNYILSSKYKDLPIIGEGIQFIDDDLIEKSINIIIFQNYDGGNMDSYLFKRNDEDITDEITIMNNTVSFECKLNDTVSIELKRGNKSCDEQFIINETIFETGNTGKSFDFESLNDDFSIKVNNKLISNVKEIGYGYADKNNITLKFEKPSVIKGVEIVSNINDIDFTSGYYEGGNLWKIVFTPNTTSKDKNYQLTFTADYYNPYVWSFTQKHAIEGTLLWTPQTLTYDTTGGKSTIQITKATGTLTPYYEINSVKFSTTGGDMTSAFQSVLKNDTGILNIGQLMLSTGKYIINMKVSGLSNETYIVPSSFQPIQGEFSLIVK